VTPFRVIFAAVAFLVGAAAWARDFPDSFAALDTLYAPAPDGGLSFFPGGSGEFAYVSHALRRSDEDSFDVRGFLAFTLLRAGDSFALGARWGSVVLVGPIGPGETAPTVAEWWMNAAQYEYGLSAAVGGPGEAHFLAEYSRTSQHPWRDEYSEVTTDAVKAGVSVPGVRIGHLLADFRLVAGYVDLFDFWKSAVPRPRTAWVAAPAAELSWRRARGPSPYAKAQADLLLLRRGGASADLWAELGVAVGPEEGGLRLFIDLFLSEDTEELRGKAAPAALAGFGIRLSL